MNDNAGWKANENEIAPRSIRIEFGRPAAFRVAVVETVESYGKFRHSSEVVPVLGARICERRRPSTTRKV
jgi:hypothetical protein